MSFVLKSIFKKVVDQAEREGLSPKAVSHLGISDIIHSKSKYAPTEPFFDLYEIIDRHLKSGFSIRVGQHMVLDDYNATANHSESYILAFYTFGQRSF